MVGTVSRETRYDYSSVVEKPEPVRVTPDGFKVWRGTFTYGDVINPYRDPTLPGGVRQEWRPIEEALSEEALGSAEGKPIVNLHPDDLLNPDTADLHSKGAALKIWREGDKGRVEFISHSADLDKAIEEGRVELSPGYDTDVVMKPGTAPDGTPYHGVQTKITYNHIAIVDRARTRKNGEPARITKDADDMDEENDLKGAAGDTRADGEDTTTDSKAVRKDMLSDEGMALLEQLGDEDKAYLASLMEASGEMTDQGDEGGEMETETMDMAAMAEKITALEERMSGMSRSDSADKAPAKTTKTEPRLDADAIIQRAEEHAKKIAHATTVATSAEIDTVRRQVGDSWDGAVTSSKLGFVAKVLPQSKTRAEGYVKAGRMDALDVLFETALATVDHNASRADTIDQALHNRLLEDAKARTAGTGVSHPVGAR